MAVWLNAHVKKVINCTDKLFKLVIKAPIAPFTAGQYIKLALEIDGERVVRPYSFVNSPNKSELEFYLVTVPEGKLSPRLHALQPDDEVLITKEAQGFFILDKVPECETLWMLATGTAIGPYLSILEGGIGLERFRNIVLLHAARYNSDFSYLPNMQDLAQRYSGQLQIQTVVSREKSPGSLHGRVPELIENCKLENTTGLRIDAETSHVMLCGNPQMVRDTQQFLKNTRSMRTNLKHKPGHITSEHYW